MRGNRTLALDLFTKSAAEKAQAAASHVGLPGVSETDGDLTMYKPNFCAECGARVERARWRVWTSRRFCAQCARRFQRSQILVAIIAGAMIFGLGLSIGRFQRQSPPPLIVERGELPAVAPTASSSKDAANTTESQNGTDTTATTPKPETVYGPDGTPTERPTDPNETISICGARTQKGTPCRRRVRGTGRCWQHKGLPAIRSADKLTVKG